jgi:hypothetical protein
MAITWATRAQAASGSQRDYAIELRMDGKAAKTVNVQNKVGAGWIVLDVLGGVVPMIIDAVMGSWYGFDQNSVTVILDKGGFNPFPAPQY